MFAGSRFCAHCGAEVTREMEAGAKPLPCPRCKDEAMQSLLLGTTAVRECGACGGLWLDPQSLQRLVDKREEHTGVIHALSAAAPKSKVTQDVVKYLPCPICEKFMNRVNFARASGIIVDMCKEDGVWLDRGELRRIMEFVEAGGMTVSRQREQEKIAQANATAWFAALSGTGSQLKP